MPKIQYDYFECPEADCPNKDPNEGLPCIIQIAEGERRRCPCERKIKLGEDHRVAPPQKSRPITRRSLIWGGSVAIFALILIIFLIPSSPMIEIEDDTLRFDPTPVGGERRGRVTVNNIGKGPLKIHSATATPSVFGIDGGEEPIVVKRGESAEITVVFRPAEGEPTEGRLVVASNDRKAATQDLKLVGSVAISLDEAFKVFEDLDSGSTVLVPK